MTAHSAVAAVWGTGDRLATKVRRGAGPRALPHAAAVLIGGTGKVDTWEERKVEAPVRREKERTGLC